MLSSILGRLQCSEIYLSKMSPDLKDTDSGALVTAMRDRVKKVHLGRDTFINIEKFCQYDGKGTCSELTVTSNTKSKYIDRLRQWTERVGWIVNQDDESTFEISAVPRSIKKMSYRKDLSQNHVPEVHADFCNHFGDLFDDIDLP